MKMKGFVKDTNVPANDLIRRQDAIKEFYKHPNIDWTTIDIMNTIEALPSAEPERRKGKWLYHESIDVFECSVCGRQMVRNIFDYCPWCGAEMETE